MSGPGRVARVLVDSPLPQLDQLFDYRVPDALADSAVPGVRVKVPLRSGGRIAQGWIVEIAETSEFSGRLSEVDDVVGAVPVLRPEVWRLARAVADRAAGSASDVLRLAIPSRYVRVEKAWIAEQTGEPPVRLSRETESPALSGYPPGRIEAAIDEGGRLAVQAIPRPVRLSDGRWVGAWAVTLAEAAARCHASGRSAILCVPDYRDQEQLEAALGAVLRPESIARLDARQSGGERYRAFLRTLEAVPRVIVGNRSVVYAPAHELGLLAIWDDGDALQSEPLSPGVHARDAALVRREQSGAALLLLAHTPSLEVQRLVELGWLEKLVPSGSPRPRVVVTAEQTGEQAPARIPSTAWNEAREASRSGPVLVQVAHPGYAPLVACQDCGTPAQCARCGGRLGQAGRSAAPRCRLCGAIAADWSCASCSGRRLRVASAGAGRTAEDLGRAFPGTRVIISDGEKPVLRVDAEPAIVVATRGAEPVAEGGYRAVLLLDGDRMLLRESLRVAEDCLRWWSNAAALAAHDAPVFLVGVGGALSRAVASWRQDEWARTELAGRRGLRFPPAVRIATVRARPPILAEALEAAAALGDGVDVLGPVPEDEGIERAIVRFDYSRGGEVATALRAAIIRVATRRRRPVAGQPPRPTPTLRVRFDDLDVL